MRSCLPMPIARREALALVDRLQAAYLAETDPARQPRLRRLLARAQDRYLRRCAIRPVGGSNDGRLSPNRALAARPSPAAPPLNRRGGAALALRWEALHPAH